MTYVVCVGDLMIDVLARLPGPLAAGSDTPAPVAMFGGGAAANVAAWLAASGAQTTFVGRVGDDVAGREAVAGLAAAGVGTAVAVDHERPTGTCIVLVDPAGERTMVPSAGANAAPIDLAALPERADWLYVSGYALLQPAANESARAAIALARARGWSVAADAASAAPLAAAGAGQFLGWLGDGLLLFANSGEAAVLTGRTEATAAAKALASHCGQAVVKCGPAGAVWSDGLATVSVPALAVPVVDSTGAGDAFAAGYLAATGDVPERLAAAAALAARAIGGLGARPIR